MRQNPECNIIKCVDNWNDFRKKINIKDYSCTDICTKTEYQYEYKFKCYEKCLTGTYNNNYKCEECHPDCKECTGPNNTNCISCSSSNKYIKFGKCINKEECSRGSYLNKTTNQYTCKCDLNNCFTCSLESYNKKLCTSCEDGYYPIYDDKYDIIYPFLNCSKSPEGYYLDNSVYKLINKILIMFINYVIHHVKHVIYQEKKKNIIVKYVNMDIIMKLNLNNIKIVM